ncbi:D-alanine--poly(phosphoribitol) ligase subunit 2 [Paenibacillus jilunlii]|uniref:D-alanine--poly(Phosphoribitol) ligase subunit 2 n=2 Tax=Paenibacillus jilunlii TaxID=682956 RepID=A0A1G9M645_9BACL|nr:D-alanine--poly(phosphoribitol) ligase subunit 2 [Paenibacillus jilunlii]
MDMKLAENITAIVGRLLRLSEAVDPDTDLALLGLDSMSAVGLVVELEAVFDIAFEDDELLLKHFDTIRKIAAKVEQKRALAG